MTYIKNIIRDSLGFANYHLYKRFLKKGSRVLIYHAFGSKLRHDTYGISINLNDFERHLKYLSDNYPIKDINNFIEGETTISLTIDDGYKCTLDAVNLLAKYNLPFSLFITTDFINKQDYLSDKDLIDVANMRISHIGSHCKSHMKLAGLSKLTQKQENLQRPLLLKLLFSFTKYQIKKSYVCYNNQLFFAFL